MLYLNHKVIVLSDILLILCIIDATNLLINAPQNVTVFVGETAIFSATVHSTCNWRVFRNGYLITGSSSGISSYTTDNRTVITYTIVNTTLSDSGIKIDIQTVPGCSNITLCFSSVYLTVIGKSVLIIFTLNIIML